MIYNHQKIEKKWQAFWEKSGIYRIKKNRNKKKFYVLDMFPYPSGDGLHVGHPRGYIATDVAARFKTMKGYEVLHPMGWDAFGLPAENFALKNKIHPRLAVAKNIKRFKNQLKMFGFTYDWSREINTTDEKYYKWTQWIFLQMFHAGLAYESFEPINWCPSCKTGLANEDLEDGRCERCGSIVEKKPLRQWVLKMTAYAERLLKDLKFLDWPLSIVEQQKNWIGKSEGALVEFKIQDSRFKIDVFTTRVDTIFGCTYVVVAPEHEVIKNLTFRIKNFGEVERYIGEAKKKSDLQRTDLAKEKTGVELKGVEAINPFNGEAVPVFVADYVLADYGTGAVMAVPAHDKRDYDFALKYGLSIKRVIVSNNTQVQNDNSKSQNLKQAFEDDGILVDSGDFTGLISARARQEMAKWLKKNKLGEEKTNYKMRDWVFSRQRYWGEPIPLIFCPACKESIQDPRSKIQDSRFSQGELLNPGWIGVEEKNLPVKLPEVKSYEPSGTGESPLVNIKKWVNVKCPKCGGKAKRETNTMPQWAGSCWYYLRFIDPRNNKALVDKKKEKEWMPVDLYVGGVEHATRHLLYARFWHKFLYDIGAVSAKEPFKKLVNQGLILAADGRKMSKRWGNVINPDDMIEQFGADSLRLYEMFLGPFAQHIAWNMDGIRGMKRFLDRIYKTISKPKSQSPKLKVKNQKLERLLHQTIKKVTEDIEGFRFNTAISSLMILFNEMERENSGLEIKHCELFLKLLAPFAPHIAEEIWQNLRRNNSGKNARRTVFQSIHSELWPGYNKKLIEEELFELVVQINGKVKDKVKAHAGISQKEAEEMVFALPKIRELLKGKSARKIIFVPGRLINLVIA